MRSRPAASYMLMANSGSCRDDRRVRRRRIQHDVARRPDVGARLVGERCENDDRRDGGGRDVRRAASAPASTTTRCRRRKSPSRSMAGRPRISCRACSSTGFRAPAATPSAAISSSRSPTAALQSAKYRRRPAGARHQRRPTSCIGSTTSTTALADRLCRDRLWFFVSGRHWAYNNYVLGGVKPDGSRYFNDNNARGFPVRLTTQLSTAGPHHRADELFDEGPGQLRGGRLAGAGGDGSGGDPRYSGCPAR